MVGNSPRDGVSIKTLVVVAPHHHYPLLSEMSNIIFNDNGVKGTGTDSEGASPGRCPSVRQRGPGRHPATVRNKWTKEANIVVMECYYRANPIDESGVPIRGYRRRMFNEWIQRGPFQDITEQRICDQARAIRKNGWLSELELEMIKRNIERGPPYGFKYSSRNGTRMDRNTR